MCYTTHRPRQKDADIIPKTKRESERSEKMGRRETITIRRKPRMAGLSAAAARLGVSRTQLREVVLGNRQSKRLMARIRAAGIKVEEGK